MGPEQARQDMQDLRPLRALEMRTKGISYHSFGYVCSECRAQVPASCGGGGGSRAPPRATAGGVGTDLSRADSRGGYLCWSEFPDSI